MSKAQRKPDTRLDPVWDEIRRVAEQRSSQESVMAGFLHQTILSQPSLEKALAVHLGKKLGNKEVEDAQLSEEFYGACGGNREFAAASRADLVAVRQRDPACRAYLDAFLFFKGFLALQAWRAAHCCWGQEKYSCALYLQNRISEVFGVDIHPAAQLGKGIMIDHATGVVIGETARVGDNVSMLHGVTLGGTGRDRGDRHPKIGNGVLISVGAKVLGNIRIGDCAKIGAGSVVLSDIPPYSTAVGVPARVVGKVTGEDPARVMDHQFDTNDLGKDI